MIPLDPIRVQLGQEELRTFIAVASLHSFSAAAEALHKSTSAISYRIKMLEEGLNVSLFVRTTRSVTLTPAGEFLFEKASEIFDWLHTLPEQILECSKGVESNFTIVVNSVLYDSEAAARLLAHLVQRYPHTQFNLKRAVDMEVWDAMLTSTGHLGLGAPGFEPLSDHYQSMPLGMMHWMFVVAPGHPLAHVPHALSDDEVRRFPAINVQDTSHHAVKRSASKLPRQQEFIVPDLQTEIAAHIAGLGVGFLPSHTAQALVRDKRLVACNVVHARRPSPLSLVWRSEGGGEILNYLRDLCRVRHPLMQRFLAPIEPLSKAAVRAEASAGSTTVAAFPDVRGRRRPGSRPKIA